MTKENICPCRTCKKATKCNWTCDALSQWAEDKTFSEVANEFIDAYNCAAQTAKRRRRRRA